MRDHDLHLAQAQADDDTGEPEPTAEEQRADAEHDVWAQRDELTRRLYSAELALARMHARQSRLRADKTLLRAELETTTRQLEQLTEDHLELLRRVELRWQRRHHRLDPAVGVEAGVMSHGWPKSSTELFLVHFDDETDPGEATSLCDLHDGDCGEGHYIVIEAEYDDEASDAARRMLFGDGEKKP